MRPLEPPYSLHTDLLKIEPYNEVLWLCCDCRYEYCALGATQKSPLSCALRICVHPLNQTYKAKKRHTQIVPLPFREGGRVQPTETYKFMFVTPGSHTRLCVLCVSARFRPAFDPLSRHSPLTLKRDHVGAPCKQARADCGATRAAFLRAQQR